MSEKETPWFPPEIKPVHVGVYKTKYSRMSVHIGYSWWNGHYWSGQGNSAREAFNTRARGSQDKSWCGQTEEPEL